MKGFTAGFFILFLGLSPFLLNGQSSLNVKLKTIDLETSIFRALYNSSDIQYMRFEQRIADERVKLGLRRFFPILELGFTQSDSVTYGSPDSRIKKLSVGLEQLIYDGGKLAQSYKNQKNELRLNSYSLNLKTEELIFSVINLYTEILRFRLTKEIQRETFQNALKQLEIAQVEHKLGMITELDLLDIKLAVADFKIDLEETEQEERLLMFQFARILGSPPEETPLPAGYINPEYSGFIQCEDDDLSSLSDYYTEKAKKNSLEFMKKSLQVLQSREILRQAKWRWLPQIKANLDLSMSGNRFPLSEPGFSFALEFGFDLPVTPIQTSSTLGKKDPTERSTGLSVSTQPITNLEGLLSKRIAEINLSKTCSELDDFETDTRFTIKESLVKIDNQRETLALFRKKLKIEKARFKIQKLRMELGEIKRIDLLNSQIELAEHKIEILSKIVELYSAEIALLRSSGVSGLKDTHKHIVLKEEVSL